MKNMGKKVPANLLAAIIALSTGFTAFAATAQDVINKNATSYTAGTRSIYGPKLTQEQLNAVAEVAADFKTNYTNDSMTNDQKIRAGYDYVKNRVAYIDWDKGVGANTAYALVAGQGACSGMTRGFIALMDVVDVKTYLVHADTNDHQWILTEFDDGFAFIDIDANVSAGFEMIYHAKSHPYTYDLDGLPAVGTHTPEYGAKQAAAEGWKQDLTGWWYQNADGSYPVNAWLAVNGRWYYFESNGYMAVNKWIGGMYYVGNDGAMLANTTTPDGYLVDGSGAWVQNRQSSIDTSKTYRVYQEGSKTVIDFEDGIDESPMEVRSGVSCFVIGDNINTFKIMSGASNIAPENHEISVIGFMETPYGMIALAPNGEPVSYPFEYDKKYSLDFSGLNRTAESLSTYCKTNRVIIKVEISDKLSNAGIAHIFYIVYSA